MARGERHGDRGGTHVARGEPVAGSAILATTACLHRSRVRDSHVAA